MTETRDGGLLVDELQKHLTKMTPRQVKEFRRQLVKRLPGFIQETAQAAKTAVKSGENGA